MAGKALIGESNENSTLIQVYEAFQYLQRDRNFTLVIDMSILRQSPGHVLYDCRLNIF